MTLIDVPDGRELDVEVSGPHGGYPLVYHHGTPGSVVPFRAMQRSAHAVGLRLVTFSRPGYGVSTRLSGRVVADAAADVSAILDHLGADGCVVAGWSGGGPHALATATGLPGRVSGVLVIAGIAPYDAEGLDFLAGMGEQNIEEFGLALQGEAAIRPSHEREAQEIRGADAAGLIAGMSTLLPDVDRAVMTDEFGEDLAANFTAAFEVGVDGWVDDDLAFTRPWGFDVGDVAVPTFLWQGSEDLMVPFTHGQWLGANIPGVAPHLLSGEGHLSIGVGALDSMLGELASVVPGR